MKRTSRSVVSETSRTTSRKDSRRSESGDTLVEVLLAVIVLGLASVAMIIAFGTSISASAVHRQLSATAIVLDSVSQEVISEIQSQPVLFTCPTEPGNLAEPMSYYVANVPMAIATPYTGSYTAAFASLNPVEFWNPTTSTFTSTCESGEPQLVTITLTELSNNQTFSNSFVVDSPLDSATSGANSGEDYGAAAQLIFTTEPVGGVTGEQLATQPVVTVEDSSGNTVADDLSPVILSVTGSSGVPLTGCAGTETFGVVTFSGCTINTPGTYQLTATDGSLTSMPPSSYFTVSASADYLVFTTQPVGAASGKPLATQPVVEAYTAGQLDTNWSGTITLTASGGDLTNCPSVAAVGGIANFSGCTFAGAYFYNSISGVYLATPYTLTASASNSVPTSPITSLTFAVTGPGSASQLVFTQQPTGVASLTPGAAFTVQPIVSVEDSFGNTVTGATNAVSLTITHGSLTCTSNPLAASGGAATFAQCGGSVSGNGLTLTASSTGLASTTSASFNITGPASQLIFTTQPVAGVSGAYFTTQPVITVEDAAGNTVTAANTAITLTSSGGTLSLCSNLTPNGGIVQVATCNFVGIVGTPYTLTAQMVTGTGTLTAVSGYFSPVSAGAPTQLVFTTEPVAGPAGSAFTTQPIVSIEDSGGNVTTSSATISLSASGGGTLASCSNLTAVEGVVNVANCTFGGLVAPSTYTLTATSGSLAPGTSSQFSPSGPGPASGSNSTVSASPLIVLSNGSASSQVTVTLLDAYGNAISGKNITLSQGSTSSIITPMTDPTNASGVATFLVTDTNQEVATYSATDTSDNVAIVQSAAVSFAVQLTPPTSVVLGYGTTSGSISVNFTGPSNAPVGQTYTALACTNALMTTNCVGPAPITAGGQITGLTAIQGSAGTPYYVTVTAVASTGYFASISTEVGPQNATSQVNAPTNLTLAPSSTTAGAITATFTGSSGVAPSSYSATICQDAGMSVGCSTVNGYASGTQITGLAAGSSYYVTITANPPTGFVSATTAVAGPVSVTTQLNATTSVALAYGSVSGSIKVNFTGPSNAPGGQTYSALACTNSGMTTACVGPTAITSGGQITGLVAIQGSPGSSYYVTVTATASTGYLASTSTAVGPQAATSQVNAPTGLTLASSSTTAGAITATFTASVGTAPTSYTATVCQNSPMTLNCTTHTSYVSGAQITGLSAGANYYVTITANPPTGYVAATTADAGPVTTTLQLNAPTGVTLGYGNVSGSITVAFTAPSNAAAGQTYTALVCTGATMNGTCFGPTVITSGGQITGLAATQGSAGTKYYVTVTAVASTGYLASTSTIAGPQAAMSQVNAPTGLAVAPSTTTAGQLTATFSAGSGTAPSSYTVNFCTGAGMTGTCGSRTGYTSGAQITGLTQGTSYYITITANPPTGYLAATTAPVGPTVAPSTLNAPTGLVVASSTTTAGAITVTFTASSGTAPSSYTAKACTNTSMSTGCVTVTNYISGDQITGLTAGTNYYAEITAVASPPNFSSTSTPASGPAFATRQLNAPTAVTLGYGTVLGSITVTFTAPSNAPSGQTYTATACTNTAMTLACVGPQAVVSGDQITGLTSATNYYVTVTAVASSAYLASTSTEVGPHMGPTQLNQPTGVTLAYGTTSGSLGITFAAPSNAPVGQTYSATLCTNFAMTAGCMSAASVTSGGQITGLAATQGSAGTSYYVTVTAAASSGYVTSTSAVSGPHAATSQVNAPGKPTTASSTTTAGAITATFALSSGTAPSSYSAKACTNAGMTANCLTSTNTVTSSPGQFTGFVSGTKYYLTITANPPTGYVSATSTASTTSVLATTQLNAPVVTGLSTGSRSGYLDVTFTKSSNAPSGQDYSAYACTNAAMTLNCITSSNTLTASGQFQGFSSGTTYYVTVTAVASTGDLAATSADYGTAKAD